MIGNICLLLEEFSVLLCIHYLYGIKFKLDIKTTSYLTIYMIIMVIINHYNFPKAYTIVTYPLIFLYCGIKFKFRIKEIIVNNILYMVIVGGLQIGFIISYGVLFDLLSINILKFENDELFLANCSVLLVEILIISKLKINRLSVYLQDKERSLTIFFVFCIVLTGFGFVNFKVLNGLKVYQYFVLFVGVTLFCILAGQLGKYKIKSKEIETELKMDRLYADSFNNLIEDIRLRQHEFDNHISAIYSLHYTCDSYEKLVKAQNEYSQAVIKGNRYNKLLKVGNPLIIGFLYGKFVEAEKKQVVVTYQISISDLKVGVPVYKLVEILGNLIKNALEAMENQNSSKGLHVGVLENEGIFEIEIRNKSVFIEYEKLEKFFKKGFSKKGNSRGLGLYNVKKICNDYSLNILCENKLLDGENWVSFTITNKKEAI